jgi:hypothetical protein
VLHFILLNYLFPYAAPSGALCGGIILSKTNN